MEAMQDRILRAMNVGPSRSGEDGKLLAGGARWTPTVDISEDDTGYLIKAELPEVSKDDVKVTVENGTLMLQGERRFEKEQKEKTYHCIERSYGSFMRSFVIPDDVDPKQVAAEFKDGVLQLRLPKSEAKKPESIEVAVN